MKQRVENLFSEQLNEWADFKERTEQLNCLELKEFNFGTHRIIAQFNPARAVSTGAKLDAKSIAERKCFLCRENQPAVQRGIDINDSFCVLVNPFPILKKHFTIPLKSHEKQEILPYIADMLDFAKLLDDYTIFYNGAKCGASAPDHMHFQAVAKGQLPIESDCKNAKYVLLSENSRGTIKELKNLGRRCLLIEANDKNYGLSLFRQIYSQLAFQKDEEPMMNVFCYYNSEGWHLIIFLRKAHRPSQFYAKGADHIMVSPGAIDMAGVMVLPRKEDFDKIDRKTIADIYSQV